MKASKCEGCSFRSECEATLPLVEARLDDTMALRQATIEKIETDGPEVERQIVTENSRVIADYMIELAKAQTHDPDFIRLALQAKRTELDERAAHYRMERGVHLDIVGYFDKVGEQVQQQKATLREFIDRSESSDCPGPRERALGRFGIGRQQLCQSPVDAELKEATVQVVESYYD